MRAPLEGPRRRRCSWLQQTALRNRRPVRRLLSSAQRDRARREGRRGNVSGGGKTRAAHQPTQPRGIGSGTEGPRPHACSLARAVSVSAQPLRSPGDPRPLPPCARAGQVLATLLPPKMRRQHSNHRTLSPVSPQFLFACAAPESKITAVRLPACCAQGGGLCQWPLLHQSFEKLYT